VPKDRGNKEIDLVLLVFFLPAEHMHLISTLVVQAGHTLSEVLRDLIPQNYASESSVNMHTEQDATSFHY
jgi:hypothetical protein